MTEIEECVHRTQMPPPLPAKVNKDITPVVNSYIQIGYPFIVYKFSK